MKFSGHFYSPATHYLAVLGLIQPPWLVTGLPPRQGLTEVVTHKRSNVFCGFQEKSVCPCKKWKYSFKSTKPCSPFSCVSVRQSNQPKPPPQKKTKAIVCIIACVEECSCVNNHPLLCPDPVCCQGKPRLFARRKNSPPQERRILVSLLSLFNIAMTKFSCL